MPSLFHRTPLSLRALPLALSLFVAMPASAAPPPAPEPALSGVLNLNTATSAQLELLPRIGPKKVGAILARREKRPFKSTSELMRVKGVGPKTFKLLKPYLTVTGETTLARVKAGAYSQRADPAVEAPGVDAFFFGP